METRLLTEATEAIEAIEAVRFDTKIAVVVREDLPVWQKLNVTAFLVSGITAQHPDMMGEPYVDADGHVYNRLCRQPIICMAASADSLRTILMRAIDKGVVTSAYTEEMFSTAHDAANRAVFGRFGMKDANIVGVALRDTKKRVDKITDGAPHAPMKHVLAVDVTTEALAPFRVPFRRSAHGPAPLPHLDLAANRDHGAFDI